MVTPLGIPTAATTDEVLGMYRAGDLPASFEALLVTLASQALLREFDRRDQVGLYRPADVAEALAEPALNEAWVALLDRGDFDAMTDRAIGKWLRTERRAA